MSVTGQDVIDTARTYMGVPWKHQGRNKSRGVDCAGLVVCVARELGLSDFDYTNYTTFPDSEKLMQILHEHTEPVCLGFDAEKTKTGDLLIMALGRDRQHLGFVAGKNIIHAYSAVEAVTEHLLNIEWQRRVREVRRLPGVIA